MKDELQYIKIKNEDIPVKIVTMKKSKHIKFYMRDGVLKITKSRYCSKVYLNKVILENQDEIYEIYKKAMSSSIDRIVNGNINMLYLGEEYTLCLKKIEENKLRAYFEENKIIIEACYDISDEFLVDMIKKALKKLFTRKLNVVLKERLDIWSDTMNLEYSGFSIKSMKTKYGSCNVKTHKLNFNINLIFMPYSVIDSIVVHELAHIKFPNHSAKFYELLEKYIPNYKECRRWLKVNEKYLNLL